VKVSGENIFKTAVENERSQEIMNYNGVRVVNFATSITHIVMSTMYHIIVFDIP
jgi:hypothetical protein